MKKSPLSYFVKFLPGINQSRAEKQFGDDTFVYYDQSSFESDYIAPSYLTNSNEEKSKGGLSLNEGDVVISHALQLAAIVKEENAGKILPINFIKVECSNQTLNKEFFIYLFNENQTLKRQKERETQGIGPVLRISVASLEGLQIPNIPLEEQKKIGRTYFEILKLKNKLTQYGDLLNQLTNALLEESINEDV